MTLLEGSAGNGLLVALGAFFQEHWRCGPFSGVGASLTFKFESRR